MTSDVGFGAPSIPRTHPGAAPRSEAFKGAHSGSAQSWPSALTAHDPGAGKGEPEEKVSALGWVTPEADLKARIWDVNNLLGSPRSSTT